LGERREARKLIAKWLIGETKGRKSFGTVDIKEKFEKLDKIFKAESQTPLPETWEEEKR